MYGHLSSDITLALYSVFYRLLVWLCLVLTLYACNANLWIAAESNCEVHKDSFVRGNHSTFVPWAPCTRTENRTMTSSNYISTTSTWICLASLCPIYNLHIQIVTVLKINIKKLYIFGNADFAELIWTTLNKVLLWGHLLFYIPKKK